MSDEDAFLRKILENPADDVTRLVYADWLEEREEMAKVEFLRLEVEIEKATKKQEGGIQKRLQQLAAELDTDWLAVVSKIEIDRCEQERQRAMDLLRRRLDQQEGSEPLQFEFECPQSWEKMKVTDDTTVRFCEVCKENVHYCDTIKTARDHASQGHCIAVDLGIIRKKGDLQPPRMLKGRMRPMTPAQLISRVEALNKLDPVSEAREAAKQQNPPPPS